MQYLYFKPRMSRSKLRNSGDVAGTAKKCQVTTMKTKVKVIEEWSKMKKNGISNLLQYSAIQTTVLLGYLG